MRGYLKRAVVLLVIVLAALALAFRFRAAAATIIGGAVGFAGLPGGKKPAAPFPAWYLADARRRGLGYYAELETVPESVYSCLAPSQVGHVAKIMRAEVPRAASVDDMTGNIGGDAFAFARTYPGAAIRVLEPDPAAFAALAANAARLRPRWPVEPINSTAEAFLAEGRSRSSIKYFDPPWGGRGFRRGDPVELKLGALAPLDYVKLAAAQADVVVLKIPPLNFVEAGLVAGLGAAGLSSKVYTVPKPSGEPAFRLVFIRA